MFENPEMLRTLLRMTDEEIVRKSEFRALLVACMGKVGRKGIGIAHEAAPPMHGVTGPPATGTTQRKMSPTARARIAAAQKKRWAIFHRNKKAGKEGTRHVIAAGGAAGVRQKATVAA